MGIRSCQALLAACNRKCHHRSQFVKLTGRLSARRHDDRAKEFALTLYFYSAKAYKYVRSIIPLPHPSWLRKWSSSVNYETGFSKEAFTALEREVSREAIKRDNA